MKPNQSNRRELLRTTAIAAGISFAAHAAPRSAYGDQLPAKPHEGSIILFQGDSITDARRSRKSEGQPNSTPGLGDGYPLLIASELRREYSKLDLKIYNRGNSGNKVPDLQKRWDKDCLELKPDVLSILIGVNDMWHKMNGQYDGTVDDYASGFASLIEQTKASLPNVTIVICEPFALRCGAVKDSWYPEFDERRAAAHDVAKSAGTHWVPFQTMFDDAIQAGTKPEYWARDGVHPTLAGHALMAKTWRQVVGI